ncbi:hypothetical protein MKX01_015007 [Papaver californicum]|nr:hypothetical protein MKX01_015007 [Papaver californicum]
MDSFERKVFVGGLPWSVTEDILTDYFSKFGDVVESTIVRDKITGHTKGFGFILFSKSSSVDKALDENHTILGRVVDVKKALPRTEQQLDRSYQTHGNSSNHSISVSDDGVHNSDWFKTKKIFVGGLATITKEELSGFFEKFGKINDVVVMFDKITHRARGFGFITFESEEAVDKVMQQNFYEMNDRSVEVKRAIPRDKNNNSQHLGIGFGTLNVRGYHHVSNAPVGPNYVHNYPPYVPFYPPTGANYSYLPGYGMFPLNHFGGMPYYNGCNYPCYVNDSRVGVNQATDRTNGSAVNDEHNGGNDE